MSGGCDAPRSHERPRQRSRTVYTDEVRRRTEIEERWYPVAGPTDSGSAAQAVARAALTEGVYRVRPAHRGGERYELFRVPAWGAPISLGMA
jgi:hypothetical protein